MKQYLTYTRAATVPSLVCIPSSHQQKITLRHDKNEVGLILVISSFITSASVFALWTSYVSCLALVGTKNWIGYFLSLTDSI